MQLGLHRVVTRWKIERDQAVDCVAWVDWVEENTVVVAAAAQVDVGGRVGAEFAAVAVVDILRGVVQRVRHRADIGHRDVQHRVLPLRRLAAEGRITSGLG